MNKTELIDSIAEKSGLTKKDSEKALNAIIGSIEEALVSDDKVQLIGFGSFEVKQRAARKGRNPQTMEEIDIPESKVPTFKAGKDFKDMLNQ
jgi:DNA-binding protein HU-beta